MRNESQRPRKKWPPLSFFGSRIISCSAKTENPIPQSFFAAKPNGSSCYTGQYFCGALLMGKLAFITGVFFSHFQASEDPQRKVSKECQTRKLGEGNNGVWTGNNVSVPSPLWVSYAASPPCACSCSPEKREKNNSCYAGCRKTGKFYWAPCDHRLFVVFAKCKIFFIPTFQRKKSLLSRKVIRKVRH